MKVRFIKQENTDKLILFFSGFAQPSNLLDGIDTSCDFAYVYDYRDCKLDISFLELYKDIYIVAWSLGVFVASYIFLNTKFKVHFTIAINGTIKAIDTRYGIDPKTYKATYNNLTNSSFIKFQKRICSNADFENYHKLTLDRTILELQQELIVVEEHYEKADIDKLAKIYWQEAFISKKDRIFLKTIQENFWVQFKNIKMMFFDASHMDFQLFKQAIAKVNTKYVN